MIVTCTSCATRYLMDAGSIGPAGRQVRCARCGHVWHQSPPDDLPKSIEVPPSATEAAEFRPAPSPLKPTRGSRGLVAGWLLLILVVGTIAGGFYMYRASIAEIWPKSARLCETLGIPLPRLTLRDVSYRRERQAGIAFLLVQGKIVNTSHRPMRVPPVRVALRDTTRREIAHLDVPPVDARLAPGERTEFAARLTNPPPEAQNLEVSLVRR